MDVRGRRSPAEVIADAVIKALSGIDANITVPIDGDDIAKKMRNRKLFRITSFK
jgi:hypothetical protein